MEKGLKMICRKCAGRDGYIGGLMLDGTLSAADDGINCPLCGGEEEGEEIGNVIPGKEEGISRMAITSGLHPEETGSIPVFPTSGALVVM